jgi:hypothetical protein
MLKLGGVVIEFVRSVCAVAILYLTVSLSQMATSVCHRDPRTLDQRRADALVALAEGRGLACACGQSDCPTPPAEDPAGPRFVINVIAGEDTVKGSSEQPGYLEGYGVIDAEQVRDLAQGAALRQLAEPEVTDA